MRIPIDKILREVCYIRSGVTYDDYGNVSYKTSQEARCFFLSKRERLTVGITGKDELMDGSFIIENKASIDSEDRIVYDGKTYQIIYLKRSKNQFGKTLSYHVDVRESLEEALTI